MNESELIRELNNGSIHSQYVVIGDEPLLIDNVITRIKNALNVNESFDLDSYSLAETRFPEIVAKLYLSAFASARRLVIVKNLEETDKQELIDFARALAKAPSTNCIIITYRINKENKTKKQKSTLTEISKIFTGACRINLASGREIIHNLIATKVKRQRLNLSPAMINYLEQEFQNDITGLKNEFDKIANYLYEAQKMGLEDMKDLAPGLCDFGKYELANSFLKGGSETLAQWEELKSYLQSNAEIIDAFTRGLIYQCLKKQTTIVPAGVVEELCKIDRKIKAGSDFVDLFIELFLIKNISTFRKGVRYGR